MKNTPATNKAAVIKTESKGDWLALTVEAVELAADEPAAVDFAVDAVDPSSPDSEAPVVAALDSSVCKTLKFLRS